MIIGLSGYAGSGKDTVAKILVEHHGYIRLAFADPIRELIYEMNPSFKVGYDITTNLQLIVDGHGWDKAKQERQVRELLQDLGVGARKVFGEDFWVKMTMAKIEAGKNYVITDVRFPNEAERIVNLWGEIWRVTRPSISAVNDHISETALDDYKFDRFIHNSGSLKQLERTVADFITKANDI